jgi:hypothetical protein
MTSSLLLSVSGAACRAEPLSLCTGPEFACELGVVFCELVGGTATAAHLKTSPSFALNSSRVTL